MGFGGAALRITATLLRAIEAICSLVIVGVYGFYMSIFSTNKVASLIPVYMKALIAMAGISFVYTALGLILTLCLAGVTLFGSVALILDVCFIGVFVAIAYYSRKGTQSCSGIVDTPFGKGPANSDISIGTGKFEPDFKRVCGLQSAALAVSIIAIICFLLSLIVGFLLIKHHKKEKKFGPGPSNGYTSGTGKKLPFWKRRRGHKNTRDAELATNPGMHQQHGIGHGHNQPATNY